MRDISKHLMYFIPGWAFSSQIIRHSPLSFFSCSLLDYAYLDTLSINNIAEELGRSMSSNSNIIAWSLGGLFAIQIAYLFPKKVDKLVLISSQPRWLMDDNWQGISQTHSDVFNQRARTDIKTLLNYFLSLVNYPNRSHNCKNILKSNMSSVKEKTLIDLLRIMFEADLRESYKSIQAPILHIVGELDAVIDQRQCCFNVLNENSHSMVVNQAGHAGFLSHGETYQRIINDFLTYE